MLPTLSDTLITGTVCVVPGAIDWASAVDADSRAHVKRANVIWSGRLMVDLRASDRFDASTGARILWSRELVPRWKPNRLKQRPRCDAGRSRKPCPIFPLNQPDDD